MNASWDVVRRMSERIHTACLPVDYQRAHRELRYLVATIQPLVCVCTGESPSALTMLERVARKPLELNDVAGEVILAGQWPFEDTVKRLVGEGVGAAISDDAGEYVCESTYWSLLSLRSVVRIPVVAAFIHIPTAATDAEKAVLASVLEQVAVAQADAVQSGGGFGK